MFICVKKLAVYLVKMALFYSKGHKLFDRKDTYSLRGICMLLIIVHHVYHYLVNNYGVICNSSILNYFLNCSGYWATGCFFLLSGFGLNCSLMNKNLDYRYVKEHIYNLLFPYLYAFAINVALTSEFSMFGKGWFFRTIFVIYIVSFLIFYFIKNQWLRFAIVSALTFGYILYADLAMGLMRYYTNSIICFPIGILCSMLYPLFKKNISHIIVLSCFFVLFIIIEKFGFRYADYILSILFSFICIGVTAIVNVTNRMFDYIGKHSIMFYVLQIALLEPLLKIQSPWLYSIGILVIICGLSQVYYYFKGDKAYIVANYNKNGGGK